MANENKFKPGQLGNRETMFKPGNPHRWTPGVGGNPAGKSRYRAGFEEAFNEALITAGSPEEAAQLLWEAARAKEPWAIQSLCQRFAPQSQSLHLVHEVNDDAIDYSRLTDEQLHQLDAILEQAGTQLLAVDSGEGAEETV